LPADTRDAIDQTLSSLDDLTVFSVATGAEITRRHEALQRAREEKSIFISILTHELSTSLTSIKGYTDLLREEAAGPVNEGQLEF
jgi:signal transduction histidine kinase